MRRLLAWIAYFLAATPHWSWEFVRTFIVYDPLTHMLKEQIAGMSVDTLVQVGSGVIFAALGTVLIWPSRPSFLRWSAFHMFLERDSGSERFGIIYIRFFNAPASTGSKSALLVCMAVKKFPKRSICLLTGAVTPGATSLPWS
jgi:hypothetical protein